MTTKTRPRIESIRLVRKLDENPDLSFLGEYGREERDGCIDRQEQGDLGRNELRYFYPAMTGEETGNPDSPLQDYNRMERYNRGDWHMVGVYAEAVVSYVISSRGDRRLETLRSGGLWGIESDSGDYFAEVEREELADLRSHLKAFNVDLRTFKTKAAAAEKEERECS